MIMSLDEILENWKKDSEIDQTEPGKELLKVPRLHHKYLQILIQKKMLVKKYSIEYAEMRRVKEEYYTGSLSQEELQDRGWEPFQLQLRTRIGIEKYIESDKDLNNIVIKKLALEESIYVCESILTELKNRVWELRSYIDWMKFTNGS